MMAIGPDDANAESTSAPDRPVIQVVGIGLSGAASLTPTVLKIVESATILIGGRRHLEVLGDLLAGEGDQKIEAWPLSDFTEVFDELRSRLKSDPTTRAVILASGDPLFFGVGRLLLEFFPAHQLAFHPQLSSVQLAFSRLKLPWQAATLVSVHGRDEEQLIRAIKQGDQTIAVLTDGVLTPGAIAALIVSLDFPIRYRIWVCENLGAAEGASGGAAERADGADERAASERISDYWPEELSEQRPLQKFSPLNVVVLCRQEKAADLPEALPLIGLPDSAFKGFRDRPTLMTKREIRLLVLGALAPLDGQTIWDIGAGTGSVSVELSRLCPNARVYAIEKTAMGVALIRHNAEKLAIAPIQPIQGQAPAALANLPKPHRVFIGGSSGQLVPILDFLADKMTPQTAYREAGAIASPGRIVLALATLEHLSELTAWIGQPAVTANWNAQLTQINISRSSPVGPLTRFTPLNPVTLVALSQLTNS